MQPAPRSNSFEESTDTLIDPTPLCLKFNRRSVTNATIYHHTHPVYKVVTTKDGMKTDIYDVMGNETRVATIKRRELLPDVIKHRNKPANVKQVVKINSWLKHERIDQGLSGVTFESANGPLTWRYGQQERYRLALYQSKDSQNHIAYLDYTTPGIPIHLVINAGYHDLVEDILLSALIMEFKLKMFERINSHDLLYGPILGSLITFK